MIETIQPLQRGDVVRFRDQLGREHVATVVRSDGKHFTVHAGPHGSTRVGERDLVALERRALNRRTLGRGYASGCGYVGCAHGH